MAARLILDLLGEAGSAPPLGGAVDEGRWQTVVAMARSGVNSPLTSSVGRLFDAVAAAIGLRSVANYEGQAAIELEAIVDPHVVDAYPVLIAGPALPAPIWSPRRWPTIACRSGPRP